MRQVRRALLLALTIAGVFAGGATPDIGSGVWKTVTAVGKVVSSAA